MKRQVNLNQKQFRAKQDRHRQRRAAKSADYRNEIALAPVRAERFLMKREQDTQDVINKLMGRPGATQSSK
jgi:hypothetical protein